MTEILMQLLDKIGYTNLQALIQQNRSLLSFLKTLPGWNLFEFQIKAFKPLIDLNSITPDGVLTYLRDYKKDYYNIISNEPTGVSWLKNQVYDLKEYLRKV